MSTPDEDTPPTADEIMEEVRKLLSQTGGEVVVVGPDWDPFLEQIETIRETPRESLWLFSGFGGVADMYQKSRKALAEAARNELKRRGSCRVL